MKIVDDAGKELPWDGKAFGDLLVRGPWISSQYFAGEGGDPLRRDEQAGLVPDRRCGHARPRRVHADHRSLEGRDQVRRRVDQLHRPGERRHGSPGGAEAAVVGVRHPKWDERPLLLVVNKADAQLTREDLLKFFEGRVAKWWIPDDVVFVDELPHTATGKLLKTKIREDFKAHKLPTA